MVQPEFQQRIREAIDEATTTQAKIAEYADVTVQSVGAWKRTGKISRDNLKKLSEITGYRYLWLKNGELPKLTTDKQANNNDFLLAEELCLQGRQAHKVMRSQSTQRLFASLALAVANDRIDDTGIEKLADFIAALSKAVPKRHGQAKP